MDLHTRCFGVVTLFCPPQISRRSSRGRTAPPSPSKALGVANQPSSAARRAVAVANPFCRRQPPAWSSRQLKSRRPRSPARGKVRRTNHIRAHGVCRMHRHFLLPLRPVGQDREEVMSYRTSSKHCQLQMSSLEFRCLVHRNRNSPWYTLHTHKTSTGIRYPPPPPHTHTHTHFLSFIFLFFIFFLIVLLLLRDPAPCLPASGSESEATPEKRPRPEEKEGGAEDARGTPKQKNRRRCYRCQTKLELVQQELGSCRCGQLRVLHAPPSPRATRLSVRPPGPWPRGGCPQDGEAGPQGGALVPTHRGGVLLIGHTVTGRPVREEALMERRRRRSKESEEKGQM
ncbi:hypothetical protein INR49_010445, partial [Caranx melampygus]